VQVESVLDVSGRARQTGSTAPHSLDAPALPHAGLEAFLVAAVAGLTYALTLSEVPALTHDSLGYQLAIEAGGRALWHPHHLVYNALARGWLEAMGTLGIDDPLVAIESLNAIVGGVTAALVWLVLRRRARLSPALCAAGTAGAAMSYGLWFYSVSIEVYVLPLALVLGALFLLTAPVLSARVMVAVGVVNGLAVVAHQVNVLFAVVVVAVAARGVDRPTAVRRIVAYGTAAAATVVAVYGAVLTFAIQPTSVGDAIDWLTRYAQGGGYWHFSPTAPLYAVLGAARSLVGGHFAYRFDTVNDRMQSTFTSRSVDDEAFLVRDLPAAGAVALVVVAVVGAGLLAATLLRGYRRRCDLPEPAGAVLRALAVWLAVYAVFFLVWEPENPEFWIPQVTVIWMLAAVLSGRGATDPREPARRADRRRAPVVLAGAALAVGTANLFGTILPATDAGNDVYAVRYRALDEVVDAGDLVVVDHPHLGLGYTQRYTDARARAVYDYRILVSTAPPVDISSEDLLADLDAELDAGRTIAIDGLLIQRPTPRAERAGAALRERYAERWRALGVPGAVGWYLVTP
jgi:hypothetical protein